MVFLNQMQVITNLCPLTAFNLKQANLIDAYILEPADEINISITSVRSAMRIFFERDK